jgi:hypothetical protein
MNTRRDWIRLGLIGMGGLVWSASRTERWALGIEPTVDPGKPGQASSDGSNSDSADESLLDWLRADLGKANPGSSQSLASEPMRLPMPLLDPSMSADAQREAIDELDDFEKMSQKKVTAHHELKMEKFDEGVTGGVFRSADYYFIAYGKLQQLSDRKWMGTLFAEDGKSSKTTSLEPDREPIADDAKKGRSIDWLEANVFDKVWLSVVLESRFERTDAMLIGGARVVEAGPEGKVKSTWSPYAQQKSGQSNAGSDSGSNAGSDAAAGGGEQYVGLAGYTFAMPLAGVEGALWIESHLLYYEPEGWFGGRNLLQTKLPLLVQNRIRAARQELAKAP